MPLFMENHLQLKAIKQQIKNITEHTNKLHSQLHY